MAGDILDRFNPKVSKLLKLLFTTENFGLKGERIQIKEPKSGCSYPPSTARNLDRFKVYIPFAGHTLKWEVIFSHPELPPDFIFGNQELDFVPDIEKMQSLIDWDHNNPQSFVTLIKELVQHYKHYQTELVKSIPRMQIECDYLLGNSDYSDYEVHFRREANQMYDLEVNILIKIPVDVESIPPYLLKDNPGIDMACLLLTYISPDGKCHVTPRLYLSPRLESALGGSSTLRIPQWGGQNGSCLMDYLPVIHQLLKQKVTQVSSGYQKRKEYVSAFMSSFGGSVLEYDADTYYDISLLLNVQGFFCIAHISLSVGFPLDKPTIELQSIYHEIKGVPYSITYREYPYSPRWSGELMSEAARTFFLEKIPEFKEASVSNGTF
ncbi:BRISC and BRCA1-A complex member 2 [Exaiptasia diaphana]|uniref:BRISC and BRCA1-A complex member 2 n=1 Tax=Exaiptasia diaphana TaxID=2652724 RepID=A0A913X8Q5_EXADI|nr:BRISC and BRCA1-A complex member 2 [Exaiptasia diaphana]KXJ14464.1 BRCA1-A complex subunit BRE [Exaiptasia diaphana]